MAIPSSGFSLQDVITEIQKFGAVVSPQSLSGAFATADESGFALPGRDSLADFAGYGQPNPFTPEIQIITPSQDPLTINFNASPITFTVSTNTTYTVSSPSWISISSISSTSFLATFEQNPSTSSDRQGDITVTTTYGSNDVSDKVTIIQQEAPVETITTTPGFINNVSYNGQNGLSISVDTIDPYSTSWNVIVLTPSGLQPVSINNISPSGGIGDGSFTFNVAPNNDTFSRTSFIRVYKSSQDPNNPSVYDDTTISQVAAPNIFSYSDAGVSGFSVARNTGQVTAPTASAGTITNLSYSSGYSGGFYPLVTSDTTRSVTVSVQVPAGYDNSGQIIVGSESTIQDRADEVIFISSSTGPIVDPGGEAFAVSVDTTDIYSTAWTAVLTYADPSNASGWVQFAGGTTGDGSFTVFVEPNYPGSIGYDGTTRNFDIRVDRNGGGLSSNTLSFSQAVTSAPPPPPTPGWICVDGNCIEVSDGAEFGTLTECQNNCTPPPVPGYVCIDGACYFVSDGATYGSLSSCEADCIPPPPPVTWSCDGASYTCFEVYNGTGTYSSLAECQNNCQAPPPPPDTSGFNCVNGVCTFVESNATYSTIDACEAACTPPPTPGYNCVNSSCVFVSDNAEYATLQACQNVCLPPPPPPTTGYNCKNGVCVESTGTFTYATIQECEQNCNQV